MKKKIAVFHTGGTIAMTQDIETGTLDIRNTNPFLSLDKELFQHVELLTEHLLDVPSPYVTEQEMLTLQKTIKKTMEKEQIDGVVVTHGTDILEETAYFLDLTLQTDIPIIVTGAMRSSNEIGSDGLHNFISAVRVASSPEAKDMGVLVVLNDEIHAASNVTKTHTSNVATFQSPQFGPIGIVTKTGIVIYQKLLRKEHYEIDKISKNIHLLKAYAGMKSDIFTALAEINIDGLVIEALGQGNLPRETMVGIHKLLEKKIPIVLVSRCFNGFVEDVYGYDGGGKQLKDLGVIFSNGINGPKARLKLMIAAEVTEDLASVFQ